jgi:hypothetical protein
MAAHPACETAQDRIHRRRRKGRHHCQRPVQKPPKMDPGDGQSNAQAEKRNSDDSFRDEKYRKIILHLMLCDFLYHSELPPTRASHRLLAFTLGRVNTLYLTLPSFG